MGWAGVAKEAARGLTAVRGRSALALVGIVVGDGIARAMRDGGATRALGQRIKLAGQLWNVIGVLAPSGSSRFNHPPDQSVYIPVRAAALFTDQDAVGDVIAGCLAR